MQQHFFSFESSEFQKETDPSSHCSSVEDRLATYGSEALDSVEHLGLILGSQEQAEALLKHFGSLTVLARATVDELLPFVPRSKAFDLLAPFGWAPSPYGKSVNPWSSIIRSQLPENCLTISLPFVPVAPVIKIMMF